MKEAFARYREICQAIYDEWRRSATHPLLREWFSTEHVPEPYLDFGDGDQTCLFLTTNPGAGMAEQLPAGLAELASGVLPSEYHVVSKLMAQLYQSPGVLKGPPLGNIRAMQGISQALGCKGLLQVEMIPWHSPNLPNKLKAMRELSAIGIFNAYQEALRGLIDACPIALSWSAGIPERRGGDGVAFKATALGLNPDAAELHEISRKSAISQGLLWQRQGGKIRGLFVNHGAANLPANNLLSTGQFPYDRIAATLQS